MRLSTYILMIALIALVGLCTVHETLRQTRAKYEVARLLQREEELRQEFARLKGSLASLKAAPRLERLVAGAITPLVPLEPAAKVPPRPAAPPVALAPVGGVPRPGTQ